jgi:hypothetical protein
VLREATGWYGGEAAAMMSSSGPGRVYQGSVRVLSLVFIGLGAVILVTTLARGGGPVSVGVLMGLVFVGVGCGRLYIASKTRK